MLSILDINDACSGSSDILREGEEFLRSGQLIFVGVKDRSENDIKCIGLAAEIAGELNLTHEVEVEICLSVNEKKRIKSLKCQCPDGTTGKCKHSISLLIHLYRTETDLPNVRGIHSKPQSANTKESHDNIYEAELSSACDCKPEPQSTLPVVTDELKAKWRSILLKCRPTSK